MATNLSTYFRQRRLQLGLRHGDLARLMGYKSVIGAANKIVIFEERGDILADLFEKLAAVLGIDEATVQQLVEEDRREFIRRWNEWANEPIEPHLVFRAIPGVFFEQEMPPSLTSGIASSSGSGIASPSGSGIASSSGSGIASGVQTPEAMERYAAAFAKEHHKKVWLVLTRRL
ncbi:MAG: hypothetical protein ABR915_23230, partial [Thermoguttaceae bacterium]